MTTPKRRDPFGGSGYAPRPRRTAPRPDRRGWLTVGELNRRAAVLLEDEIGWIGVEGEVSNVVVAGSGHVYFSLKDGQAQISAVMWRSAAQRTRFRPTHGDVVRARGRLTVYSPRGQYQLVVEELAPAGAGDLEARLRKLRAEYEAKGYFDAARKRPLPRLPRTIGIVTSPSGAAIHDMLRTIHSRFPAASVLLYPARVQGEGAAAEVAAGIEWFSQHDACDVMIVGRGGGSLEDLWAFNEPAVVEAVFASTIPVVSAVGHEVDTGLSDLVADVRALTPTDAGHRVVPERRELDQALDDAEGKLRRDVDRLVGDARQTLEALARSWALREPRHLARRSRERLDGLEARLRHALPGRLERARRQLDDRLAMRAWSDFGRRFDDERRRVDALDIGLRTTMTSRIVGIRRDLDLAEASLRTLSPFAVLARGYSVTLDEDGAIVRDIDETSEGQVLRTILHRGEVTSTVDRLDPHDETRDGRTAPKPRDG